MGWKPKTIFGKILKGAVTAGGTVLGLATGIGAISGIAKGTGALAGITKGIGAIKPMVDKVGQGAAKLITGKNKEERQLINAQKDATRAEQHKLDLVDDLVRAGATPEQARAKVGLSNVQLTSLDGEIIPTSAGFDFSFDNPIVKYGSMAAGLFILAKVLKIIK
jgi:hypothetical protein